MTYLVILFLIVVALAVAVSVGQRRGPVIGIAAGVGVLVAGFVGYGALLAVALPM